MSFTVFYSYPGSTFAKRVQIVSTYANSQAAEAERFAQQGMAYSATRAACDIAAKVQRDVRLSKLITFANKI